MRRWVDQSVCHRTLALCEDMRDDANCSYLILPPDTGGRSPGCVHTVPHSSRSKCVHSELCTADLQIACLCGTVGLSLKRKQRNATNVTPYLSPKGINSLHGHKTSITEQLNHNPDYQSLGISVHMFNPRDLWSANWHWHAGRHSLFCQCQAALYIWDAWLLVAICFVVLQHLFHS